MIDRDFERPEPSLREQPHPPKPEAVDQTAELSRERESVESRGYCYQVSPSEMATLREIGRFRTIASHDLATYQYGSRTDDMQNDLAALRDQGLVRERSIWVNAIGDKLNVLVLTKAGRDLAKFRGSANDRQALYAGFVKPAEVAHDAAIFRMYQAEAARIQREGGTIRRVVLDYELKQNVYRPLAKIRPHVKAHEYAKRQAEVAAANGLKVVQGKIPLPDLRIEYETRSGVGASVDLELATEHYRASMMRGKAEAGFKFYAPGDSAAHLAAAFDPEFAAEIFSF
jgi:hypothetical protein